MQSKHFYSAIATLTGTIIGAGVLGIPYVIAQAGFLTGLANLAVISTAVLFLYLYLGEVVLRTEGNHQLAGYARLYLGKTGEKFMIFAMVFGIYGALLAYFIGEGEILAALFKTGSPLYYSLGFYALMSYIVHRGLKAVEKSELLLSAIVVGIILLISVFAAPKIEIANLSVFNPKMIFVPFGVILFSLAGSVAIPEMKEELIKNRKLLKKAIIAGSLIPAALYIIFSIVIVGSNGIATSEIATTGLAEVVGAKMFYLGNIFAVLAMATSFLTLGLALKEMYNYDYKISRGWAWALTVVPPLVFFFILNLILKKSFVGIIDITGGFAMGIEGILIVLIYQKAIKLGKRKPEYSLRRLAAVEYGIMAVFLLGVLYTISNFLGIV